MITTKYCFTVIAGPMKNSTVLVVFADNVRFLHVLEDELKAG